MFGRGVTQSYVEAARWSQKQLIREIRRRSAALQNSI
jgi:hypothetical protein